MSEPEPITVKPMAKVFAAYADLERQLDEAQGKVEAVGKWRELHGAECNGRSEMDVLDRILRGSKEAE